MMHSGTPETGQKSRFFDLFSPRKRYKLSNILFSVLWSVPQTNSSTEEAITSQSSTLPVAFRSGFLPISPETGFFHAKCVSKRSPTASLVVVTLCSITLKALGCFLFVFCNCCGYYFERSRSYQEQYSKMPKITFLRLLH